MDIEIFNGISFVQTEYETSPPIKQYDEKNNNARKQSKITTGM